MYIDRVPNRNSRPCVLLRESYREDGKIKKRTVANLSSWPDRVVDSLKIILDGGEAVGDPEGCLDVVRSLPHGHVAAVLHTMRRLGIPSLMGRSPSPERDAALALIGSRILDPRSKLACVRGLRSETATSTLGAECGVDTRDLDEHSLYRAMDWLFDRKDSIEDTLAARHLSEGTLVLYDLTSVYFEGRTCPLAKRGHNRDGKKGKLQIEVGLLCDFEGCPVAVEVFEGNTGDPSTVSSQISKLRERFNLKSVVVVGDRGMLTSARIREEFSGCEGLDWISALRGSAIKQLVEDDLLQPSLFDDRDMAEISSPDYPDERLIVCRNPLLATERAMKREELLAATERNLQKISDAVARDKRPLRGKGNIGVKVGRIINKHKMAKHFSLDIGDESFSFTRKDDKIENEALLDGFYVIRTSVPSARLDADKTVEAYKRLSVVERAFRSMKTMDLKIRPVHHRLADRVKAHVFICFLAYYVEWHMRQALAPMLFDDDDKAQAARDRKSVVAPAVRSASARRKAAEKRTEDGLAVHSFQTLLADMATITKNTIRTRIKGSPVFEKVALPTPLQKKALDLLGARL